MCLAVDADKHLIKMPAPVRIGSMMNAVFPDLDCKHRTKAVSPIPHRFVTDVDAPFVERVLDLAQGQRESNLQYHGQPDALG